jgi:hypothetical protein
VLIQPKGEVSMLTNIYNKVKLNLEKEKTLMKVMRKICSLHSQMINHHNNLRLLEEAH